MKWACDIPGRPVSVDAMYRTGLMPVYRKGKPVMIPRNGKLVQKEIHRPVLTKEASKYRDDAQYVMQAAKPSRWAPTGQIRIRVTLELAAPIDADNCLKILGDALQRATGINDVNFLWCHERVTFGVAPVDERVRLIIDDDPTCCFGGQP